MCNSSEFITSASRSDIRPVVIGQFGPPTLTCIRSWGEQGFSVGMVVIQSKNVVNPRSRYLTDFTILPPKKLYTDDGLKIVEEFLIKFRGSGITCVAESIACWLNDQRQSLPHGVEIWLPSNSTIKSVISKENQIETARKVGFNILPTYYINQDGKTSSPITSDHFPLCLRPTEGNTVSPSFKVRLINSPDELRAFIGSLHKLEEPIIAQPFMKLPNLVVHGARTLAGTSIGLQAFLVERKFEGVTLTIRPVPMEKGLRDKCIEFTHQFNITGNYHFEFLINSDNGTVYFLEINCRLGGTTAKVYACGYDEPLLALEAYGVKVKSQDKIREVTVSSKQALLKYLYYTLRRELTPLDYPSEPSFIRVLKTIYGLLKYRDDVFSFRDLRGSLALYWGNIKSRG